MSDSNTFLAVAVSISSFLFFKNLRLKYNKVINTIAASTFGVLQIHANSDAMRKWLWTDVLNNVEMYDSSWLVVHAIGSVICIFGICVVIDLFRRIVFDKFVLHLKR